MGSRGFCLAEPPLPPGVASPPPGLLIPAVADAPSRIRVGSGAVLLGHHQPLVVAEQFGTIAQLHPDRIDLGLGRIALRRSEDVAERFASPEAETASSSTVVDGLVIPPKPKTAGDGTRFRERIERQRRWVGLSDSENDAEDYQAQVGSILRFVDDTAEDPPAVPAQGAALEVWVLGSSAGPSSAAAGALGLPYAANYHVSPSTVLESVRAYREAFVPSASLTRPYVVVSADVVVADTDAEARVLASPYARWVLSIRSGAGAIPYPSPVEASAFPWTEQQRAAVADRTATQLVGSPEAVVDQLTTLQRATGADELVITTVTHEHADRVRSYELLAEAWARAGRSRTTVP